MTYKTKSLKEVSTYKNVRVYYGLRKKNMPRLRERILCPQECWGKGNILHSGMPDNSSGQIWAQRQSLTKL